MKAMRQTTLETVGLGSVIDMFRNGASPANTSELVDKVFGPANDRGSLVISGGNGIVGSGKAMQLGARLIDYDVPIVTIDLPDAPDGLGQHYPGLKGSFGPEKAGKIMANIVKLNYDGKSLPDKLGEFKPRFLLEAIPEILNIKLSHYELMRKSFPGIEMRSVTSGFPNSVLGVGVLHPSFPHQINKVWEVVEEKPSDITKLLWSIGLMPITVGDYWSFILDVLFCGITLTATRYHHATNMPFWKIDKFIRRLVGPNPVRAHDAIGPGASFLTWSCLHHLTETYGEVFSPTPELMRRKESGESWYSSNRPVIDWKMSDDEEFKNWILGPLYQMTSLMLHEDRAHLSHMNAIGELCAQFTNGILAMIRGTGADDVISRVEAYHKLHPEAAGSCWYPEVFENMDNHEWQQLYVNAEHDEGVGVITISRESLNWDVIDELNRAMDWLKAEGIDKVIVTGDFHMSTQMVGADTSEFYPALDNADEGIRVSKAWSETARRLYDDFEVSVGFIAGKRCLGGMLELLMHCHYLVSIDGAQVGLPEVTLPVIPGMEGCHWAFRKANPDQWQKVAEMLLDGKFIRANNATGWLIDFAGPLDDALKKAWAIVKGDDHGIEKKTVATDALDIPRDVPGLSDKPAMEPARKAIMDCIQASCGVPLSQALEIQAKHSGGFMTTKLCQKGEIGSSAKKIMNI